MPLMASAEKSKSDIWLFKYLKTTGQWSFSHYYFTVDFSAGYAMIQLLLSEILKFKDTIIPGTEKSFINCFHQVQKRKKRNFEIL